MEIPSLFRKCEAQMKLTSEMIKARATELGIDIVAIGNIERFAGAPKLMNPSTYYPGCKSVIAVAMRIPRGTYRGIEEGTHWHNYTFYSYNKLNSFFRPRLTYELCRFIEDHGWEAVAHYPAVPEGQGTQAPVAPEKVPPDVVCSIRLIAAGTGIGEIGWSKVLLTKKFGPRVRLGLIFTDAVLDPDPILDTGTICMHCGACRRECPGNAVPDCKDETQRITIDYGEKQVYYGDVHMGRCTLTHHGFNNECSPFHKKDFPNMEFDVRSSKMTEEEAYILCYGMAQTSWGRKPESGMALEYYDYILKHTGYFAVCGAKGCIRGCMDMLEKAGRIENTFHNPFHRKKCWTLANKTESFDRGINPFREAYLDENFPDIRKNEYHREGDLPE